MYSTAYQVTAKGERAPKDSEDRGAGCFAAAAATVVNAYINLPHVLYVERGSRKPHDMKYFKVYQNYRVCVDRVASDSSCNTDASGNQISKNSQ